MRLSPGMVPIRHHSFGTAGAFLYSILPSELTEREGIRYDTGF
jgi:hypothetical protein